MNIIIKEIDKDNVFDVVELTTNKDGVQTLYEEYICSNSMSLSEAKDYPEMNPNAIYNDDASIGFFMFKISEEKTNRVTMNRFMIDYKYHEKKLGRSSFKEIINYF